MRSLLFSKVSDFQLISISMNLCFSIVKKITTPNYVQFPRQLIHQVISAAEFYVAQGNDKIHKLFYSHKNYKTKILIRLIEFINKNLLKFEPRMFLQIQY